MGRKTASGPSGEILPKKVGDYPWKMGDHPWEVDHPNGIESCQKSIGTIRCNLAISYNNWQRSLIFLDTQNERNKQSHILRQHAA